jgi:hypothetical protein
MLMFNESTGCRIVRLTVSICGLLNPLVAVTCTSAGAAGLAVRAAGFAVNVNVSPTVTAQASHVAGLVGQLIVPSAPTPEFLTFTFLTTRAVVPRIAWKFSSLGDSWIPGGADSDTVTVRVTLLFGASMSIPTSPGCSGEVGYTFWAASPRVVKPYVRAGAGVQLRKYDPGTTAYREQSDGGLAFSAGGGLQYLVSSVSIFAGAHFVSDANAGLLAFHAASRFLAELSPASGRRSSGELAAPRLRDPRPRQRA